MVILSRNDIERIAERVIRAYKKLPEFENKKVYNISPKILLERLLNLRIDYGHLSQDRQTLGVTITRGAGEVEIYNACDEAEIYLLDGRTVLIEQDLRDDATQKGSDNFKKHEEKLYADYDAVDKEVNALTQKLADINNRHTKLVNYIKGLQEKPLILEKWDTAMWITTIRHCIVHRDDSITFVFRDGAKIDIQPAGRSRGII